MEIVRLEKNVISRGGVRTLVTPLTAALISLGMTGSFSALGGFPILAAPFFGCALAVAALFLLKRLASKRDIGPLACLAAAFALFMSHSAGSVKGVYMWLDGFRSAWNGAFGTYFEGFEYGSVTTAELTGLCLTVSVLLALLVCRLLESGRTGGLTLLSFAFLAGDMLLAPAMPAWIEAALFVGWLLSWMGASSGFETRVALLSGCLAALMAAMMILAPWGEGWSRAGASFREGTRRQAERLRYGSDTLPEGDLTRAASMNEGEQVMLTVEMSRPEALYLRSFVGGRLEGNAWQPTDASAYGGDYRGMLDWLDSQGFSPAFQYDGYKTADGLSEDERQPVSVTVEGQKAKRKYIYLPETAASLDGAGYAERDLSVRSSGLFGRSRYSFAFYPSAPTEVEAPSAWVNGGGTAAQRDFSQAEQVYRAFVYDNYLDISDEDRELALRAFFSGDAWEGSDSLYTMTSRVRAVLRILAKATDDPPALPAGQAFLPWFLGQAGSGNSGYFATAAVMAYRAAGVPARYAEGYLITEAQAKEGGEISVTPNNAHAWAEVYVDGIGWRRVEVTPGFYAEAHRADVMIAVPNEAMDGSNGLPAGAPSSEDYHMPEPELPEEKKGGFDPVRAAGYALLTLFCLFICGEICRLACSLLRMAAYRAMTPEERLMANYGDITSYMSRLVEGFDPQQPMEALPLAEEIPGFDRGLYLRTVGRVERCLYGGLPPTDREVASAEALSRALRAILLSRLSGPGRFFWRYRPAAGE